MKKTMLTIGLAALGMLPVQANAKASVEALVSPEKTVTDTKASGELLKDTTFYFRNILTSPHNGTVSSFSCIDIDHPLLLPGVSIDGELQFSPGSAVDSRLGIEYFIGDNSKSAYICVTRNFTDDANTESTLMLDGSLKLSDKVKGFAHTETVFNVGKEYNFDVNRIRFGVEYAQTKFGVGLNFLNLFKENKNLDLGLTIMQKF